MALILPVIGTDTEVGKTIAAGAIAVVARHDGQRVVVYKPVQTGVQVTAEGLQGDAMTIDLLTNTPELPRIEVRVGESFTHAMAPHQARLLEPKPASLPRFRSDGVMTADVVPAETPIDHAQVIMDLAGEFDVVIVEGTGGASVPLTPDGATLLTLMSAVRDAGDHTIMPLLVTRAGLGTLNHTTLTLAWCAAQGWPVAGLIIGSGIGPDDDVFACIAHDMLTRNPLGNLSPATMEWFTPEEALTRCNLADLAGHGIPVLGLLSDGMSQLGTGFIERVLAGEMQRVSNLWNPEDA